MISRVSALMLLVCFLTACSGPGYYLQAISGQWKLMHARQQIQTLLNDPGTSPELAAQLESVEQIKRFAETLLGLPGTDSYSSYVEVEGEALVWNVVATGEFSLQAKTWCFPVAGCVPYRGFFNKQEAQASADRLRNRGMDVHVSPAVAYSTLGWFNDPLLSTMLSGSDTRLAAYLFHELAHQRLYIKGDGPFNETYASFVEQTGVKAWLESGQRLDELRHWQHLQNASEDLAEIIDTTREDLERLYQSNKPVTTKRKLKAEIFESLRHSYERLIKEKWNGRRYYDKWFEGSPNNARLALYNTYAGGLCAFQRLLDTAEGNWQEFHLLAEQKSRLPKDRRAEWLKQSCQSIAHLRNL